MTKMSSKCGLILLTILLIPYIESGYVKDTKTAKPLNEYISHYETLRYDSKHLHASHNRAKRSVTKDHHVYLSFKAHGKDFSIRLKRDLITFSDNLEVHTPDGPISTDTSHIYHGEVLGDPQSEVFGSIIDGVFEGRIITSKDSYFVEKAKHYFKNVSHQLEHHDEPFHSVIYREEHVDDPYQNQRQGHAGGCGVNDEISQWMDNVQNSALEDEENYMEDFKKNLLKKPSAQPKMKLLSKNATKIPSNQEKYNHYDFKHPYEKYSKEANFGYGYARQNYNNWHQESHERVRRAATRPKEENKNTCSLYIQTDPLIWRHIRDGIADHERNSPKHVIDQKTREEILSLIAHHVYAVNYIYRDTKFDGRVQHRNIKFEVQRTKIDDDSACSDNYNGENNPFCMENIDVSNFLNLHSLGNHEIFCLAYVFTYRDFTGGTLGLAWVASSSGASGGICEKYKTYTETVGGLYQSTKRSLNTGIITFVNYNSRVPPKVSQLTLAHEIGHNFGSPHDYPAECRPGGMNGNYIMFASATSGDRPNNSKFSTCSVRNISNVLDAIEDNKKRNCFLVSEGAFCGNKIVEAGEECDCGFNKDECTDKCCYPRILSETDINYNASAKGCTRRRNTQCSPSQGPCCDGETCRFVAKGTGVTCREETECSWSARCNGTTAECPDPLPRDDKTKCNNGTQLCIRGECQGSICLLWNMTECFLTSNIIPNIDKRKLCELACQNGNDTSTCRSTSEFANLYNLPHGGISLRPGSPCDNFQGYCDVFLKCRAVDADGPLLKLKNLLLNKQTLQTIAQWVTENWYLVCLFGIAFVIFMGIFIKCCAVHTPSNNPKKPPARRLTDTLRQPMNTLRRMRHHHHQYPPQQGRGGPRSIPPPGGAASRSSRNVEGGGGRRAENSASSRNSQGSRNPSSGPSNSSRPQGRSQPQNYPPKATAPLMQNYNRMSNAEMYADAYPLRQYSNKV